MRERMLAIALVAVLGMSGAQAQTFPNRPVTLVVPFAAGGPVDVLARIMAERMKISLGQPVIVENVAGAAGSIAVGRVARAAPDGYTLSIGPGYSTHVVNPAIYALQYDVVKDFEPISLIGVMPELIVARKTMPADDLKGFIDWLKANPGKATQATSGVGQRRAHCGGIVPEAHRHQLRVRALSRARTGDAGPARRPSRSGDRRADQRAAAGPQRQHQGLCGDRQDPARRSAEHPDGRTRPGCRASTPRSGTRCGRRPARRRMSSASSMPRSSMRSPTRRCARGSPRSARRSCRAISRRRRRWRRCRNPRSRNGGRSSRPPTSRDSKAARAPPASDIEPPRPT